MSIKDGVYSQVAGTVGRVDSGRFTVEVKLRQDAQYPDYVTVWQPKDGAQIQAYTGDRVSLKGWLSWRKTEKDGKVYVNVSLNQPKIVDHEAAAPVPAAEDTWAEPTSTESVPF